MTSCAIFLLVRWEDIFAIMTVAAVFAFNYLRHFHFGKALFHPKEGKMAVKTFDPFVCMDLAAEDNNTVSRFCSRFQVPAGGDSLTDTCQQDRNKDNC